MAMAANQALPGLQVTAPEEDMEISDYERTADDIDIDIDISVEPVREEDDYMVDDRSEHENKDDMMLDGDGQEDEDGMMPDNFSVPDEHLTDASEVGSVDVDVKEAPHEPTDTEVRDGDQVDDFIDYDDNVAVEQKEEPQTLTSQSELVPQSTQNAFESNENVRVTEKREAFPQQAAEDITVSQQARPLHQEEADKQDSPIPEVVGREQSGTNVQNYDVPTVSVAGMASGPSVGATQESNVNDNPSETNANAPEDASSDQEASENISDQEQAQGSQSVDKNPVPEQSHETSQHETAAATVDDVVNVSHEKQDVEEHQSLTAHPLHPVVVVYNDDEISLFPPSDGDTSGSYYFLQNEELAHGSIRSLLEACRQVLGDTVQHEDELEIDIAELGLRVSEESLDAAQCSFSQVLDAYVQLHRNDGVETPGPLYVALNTRTKFSARLESIVKVVADGKGMSQLTFAEYTAEEPYSNSDHREQAPESHPEESEQAHGGKDTANTSPHGSTTSGRQGDGSDGDLDQVQEAEPTFSAQSAGVDVGSSPAEVKPVEEASSTIIHHADQSYEAEEEHYAEELPEYDSEDEKTAHGVAADSEAIVTGDFSAAPQNEHEAFDDVHKGDDDESHGSSTIRGDNTPVTTEGGTLAAPHVPEPISQHFKEDNGPSAEAADVQEFDFKGNADLAGQAQSTSGEFDDFEEREVHVGEDGNAGEDHGKGGEDAREFTENGYGGEGYEQVEEYDPNQQYETDLNGDEENFDLPSDEEHDGYDQDPSSLYHDYTADETHIQENGDDSNEAAFADQEAGEYVVVENEDAHDYTAEEHDLAVNYGDGHSSPHGEQSDDPFANQTVENNMDATLAELGDDMQRTADDQDRPSTPSAGGVDDDTIDYDDEELPRQSEEEPSAVEGVTESPSTFKRTWEEFDHGEATVDNDQALKKVKSG